MNKVSSQGEPKVAAHLKEYGAFFDDRPRLRYADMLVSIKKNPARDGRAKASSINGEHQSSDTIVIR